MIFIFYIYKITNKINNKFYIGKTTNSVNKRFSEHINDALSDRLNTHLANAIRKYGKENFIIETIDGANTEDELNKKEIEWINKLDAIKNGYNKTIGGEGGNTYQYKTKEDLKLIKDKLSQTKMKGFNPNHHSVKCKNVVTNEELIFDTIVECKNYFKEKNHNFITRRCNHKTKFVYRGEWIFSYIEDDYINDYTFEKNIYRKKNIKIITISDNKEFIFKSYKEAEIFFKLPEKFFSGHAHRYENKEYWEKQNYRIFILE